MGVRPKRGTWRGVLQSTRSLTIGALPEPPMGLSQHQLQAEQETRFSATRRCVIDPAGPQNGGKELPRATHIRLWTVAGTARCCRLTPASVPLSNQPWLEVQVSQ